MRRWTLIFRIFKNPLLIHITSWVASVIVTPFDTSRISMRKTSGVIRFSFNRWSCHPWRLIMTRVLQKIKWTIHVKICITSPLAKIGWWGWYSMRYRFCHVLSTIYCILNVQAVLLMNEYNTSWTIFQLYHGKNKLHFDKTMISALYQTNMPSRILTCHLYTNITLLLYCKLPVNYSWL